MFHLFIPYYKYRSNELDKVIQRNHLNIEENRHGALSG